MLPTYYKSLNNNFEIVYELINSICKWFRSLVQDNVQTYFATDWLNKPK